MSPADGLPLVLSPLPEEIWTLRRRLTHVEFPQVPGLRRAWTGWLRGTPVVLAVTGDGERNARWGVEAALAAFRPSRLLGLGVAGALTPDLGVGEVVAGRQVLELGGDTWEPSSELLTQALGLGIPAGTVVTAGELAATPEAKSRLAARPGVRGPAVVDLESAVYARAAEAAGVPWLVLRAVSDTARESLPAYLEACRDADGAVHRGRVIAHALTRPWTIPALLGLGKKVALCAGRLADAATDALTC